MKPGNFWARLRKLAMWSLVLLGGMITNKLMIYGLLC
jgi:hypothetical protein